MKNQFEIITRAVVVNDGKLLLCRASGHKHFFLPGGHIEFGETAIDALKRELKEELNAKIKKAVLVGAVENIYGSVYGKKGKQRHEINLVHLVALSSYTVKSKEAHLEFQWIPISKLKRTNILPISIKNLLLKRP
jgi:8-oxo-dGTP diphosphatase